MTPPSPLVSVIIPCYNQGQYLDEAVDSILSQTFQEFEIIIINDGSTDQATLQILTHYEKPKTKVIHTENQGVITARNQGIALSQGKYILSLDADDKIGDSYLEAAVELLNADDNLGIVYCEAEFFGEKTGKWELPSYSFPEILLGNMIFCSGLFRKSDWQIIGGYNPLMNEGWEDFDFWLSIIELGRDVQQIPKILFYYRRKIDSRTEAIDSQRTIKLYTYLFGNHTQLYEDNIEAIFTRIVELKEQIKISKKYQRELKKCKKDLRKSREKIKAMESSKFWQLREQWFRLKSKFPFR